MSKKVQIKNLKPKTYKCKTYTETLMGLYSLSNFFDLKMNVVEENLYDFKQPLSYYSLTGVTNKIYYFKDFNYKVWYPVVFTKIEPKKNIAIFNSVYCSDIKFKVPHDMIVEWIYDKSYKEEAGTIIKNMAEPKENKKKSLILKTETSLQNPHFSIAPVNQYYFDKRDFTSMTLFEDNEKVVLTCKIDINRHGNPFSINLATYCEQKIMPLRGVEFEKMNWVIMELVEMGIKNPYISKEGDRFLLKKDDGTAIELHPDTMVKLGKTIDFKF